jgi:methionine synthase II (cobalamin-independent)
MFATLVSGYPTGPLPGGVDDLGEARRRHAAGTLDGPTYDAFVDAWVASVVDEQVGAGLSLVCDAEARWPHGQLGLARDLLAGATTAADLVAGWQVADAAADVLVKQVLPGPWSSSLALARTTADREAMRRDLVDVLAAAAAQLVAAGCPFIQIDEPAAAVGADDGPGTTGRDLVGAIERLVAGLPTGTSVCVAIPGGAPRPGLHDAISALPVQSLLVDVVHGPDGWRCVERLSPDQGVIVGALDATTPDTDDAEMLLWAGALAARMGDRGPARVGVAPTGSLATIDRYRARRKVEELGLAVRLAAMGPLQAVADRLQPDPANARIRGLPQLYRDWQEATHG